MQQKTQRKKNTSATVQLVFFHFHIDRVMSRLLIIMIQIFRDFHLIKFCKYSNIDSVFAFIVCFRFFHDI